jgi:hypothetical protein
MTPKQEVVKINKDTEIIKKMEEEFKESILADYENDIDDEVEEVGNDEDYIMNIDSEF